MQVLQLHSGRQFYGSGFDLRDPTDFVQRFQNKGLRSCLWAEKTVFRAKDMKAKGLLAHVYAHLFSGLLSLVPGFRCRRRW
jgi:hypothetical protein